jgi:D-3-phosphoglycerate dehydrogenase / 2-oxoglutarate reductase
MIIAIPDDYHGLVHKLDCISKLAGHEVRIFRDAAPAESRLIANLQDAEVIVPIRERTHFTRGIIAQLPRLGFFSQTGRSAHHIDLAACSERGIAVAAGTHASPYTVAEHTWALILAALRRIPQEVQRMKEGKWQGSVGIGLAGKTLGVYAYGRIGSLVARAGKAFGMKVVCWGREGSTAKAREAGFNKETRGIVTAQDLARMKPTALIVNTSRAQLIAEGALVAALQQGRPGLAAIDVYESEPVLGGNHPLLKMDNVVCTPHLGYVEQGTYESYFGAAIDHILAYAEGKPINVLNPEVLEKK